MAVIADLKKPPPPRVINGRRSARKPGRINLQAVAEALAERGLDPTHELIEIVAPLDENGQPTDSVLDPEVRARVLNELLQYTQPKLKSIEVKGKLAMAAFDVTNEQAQKIAEEYLRSKAAGG